VRLLVAAQHPFRLDDLGLDGHAPAVQTQLVRRLDTVEEAVLDGEPDVVIIDTSFANGAAYEVIARVLELAPGIGVLALTPSHPSPHQVALAARAGAAGFVTLDSSPEQVVEAVTAAKRGRTWFPQEDLRNVLADVADELDVTHAERRSRMTGILIGLIPLTGLVAALLSYLWRKYLGQIGVRPVDLAIDPTSRVVDAISTFSLVLGVFAPLLLVSNWLALLRGSSIDRGPVAWLLDRRRLAQLVVSLAVLAITLFLSIGPDLMLVVVIGPIMTISIVARAADLNDELPSILRIEHIRPMRLLMVTGSALMILLAALAAEALFVGPDLGNRGAGGYIAPKLLGFRAQPVRAFDLTVDSEPRELLYLGGNADLYVLVDPCNDREVEMVPVSTRRLVVIDEITCVDDTTAED
jgi:hypothetical protein